MTKQLGHSPRKQASGIFRLVKSGLERHKNKKVHGQKDTGCIKPLQEQLLRFSSPIKVLKICLIRTQYILVKSSRSPFTALSSLFVRSFFERYVVAVAAR